MIISNKNIGIRFVDYVFFDVDFKPDNIFGYVLGILFALICLPFSFIHFRLNDYTFKKRNWALLYHNLIAHSFILCVIFTDWLNTFMISIKGTKLYDFKLYKLLSLLNVVLQHNALFG